MGEHKLKKPPPSPVTPVAFVIDRPTAAKNVREAMQLLGGAWVDMFEMWLRTEYEFVVLLAHTQERIRKRAPLTYMAATDEALRSALKQACGELSDVHCRWAILVERGSDAEAVVRAEILLDAIPEGSS